MKDHLMRDHVMRDHAMRDDPGESSPDEGPHDERPNDESHPDYTLSDERPPCWETTWWGTTLMKVHLMKDHVMRLRDTLMSHSAMRLHLMRDHPDGRPWDVQVQCCFTSTQSMRTIRDREPKCNTIRGRARLLSKTLMSCTRYCQVVFSRYFACQPDRKRTPRWPSRRFHQARVVTVNSLGQIGAASGHKSLLSTKHIGGIIFHLRTWSRGLCWVITWILTPTRHVSAIKLALQPGWLRLYTERDCETGHFDNFFLSGLSTITIYGARREWNWCGLGVARLR